MSNNFADFLRVVAKAVGDKQLAVRIQGADVHSSLVEDLEFDSPGLVEMQLALEDSHRVFLSCDEINACKTIGDVYRLLLRSPPS